MKPTKAQNRIFGPSGCISKDGLSLYLKNGLTEKEKNLFEQHVAGCLLCNEALEGYEKMAENDKVFAGLNSIQYNLRSTYANSSVKNLKKSGDKRTLLTTISIAASILLIFTGFYFINILTKSDKQHLSYQAPRPEEKTISEEEVTPPLQEDVAKESAKDIEEKGRANKITATKKIEGTKDNLQNNEQDIPEKTIVFGATSGERTDYDRSGYGGEANQIKTETKQDLYDGFIDKDLLGGANKPAPSQTGSLELKGAEQEIAESYDQNAADEVATGKSVSLEKMQKAKKESGKNAKAASITTAGRAENKPSNEPALSYYNSAQYKDAIIEFEKSVDKNSNDYQAVYYLAMSYYNDGQKDAAIQYLDKILKKKSNPFYDLALWQKALILTEKNQTGEARILLDEIVKRGGTLKNNAIQKIDELDKSE